MKATDFQTPDGTSMVKNGKFDSKYLDLGGIVIDGETGNINFTSVGSITWGGNAPVKYQFSTSLSGPWHDTMQTNDKYRRDSLDGGTTWGSAYQFKGTNGSDANVPEWVKSITSTYIDDQWVIAPNIAGGTITALDSMTATCDFHVGDNIYLGSLMTSGKSIVFSQRAGISNPSGTDALQLNAFGNISLVTSEMLDLSGVGGIIWGNNAPKAVFG